MKKPAKKLKSPKQVPVRNRVGRKVEVDLARMLGMVHNNMSPVADKSAALEMVAEQIGTLTQAEVEMVAEQIGTLTQAEVDYFVLHQLPKLPGYHVRDALAILDNLTKFRERYFS